MPVTNTLTWNVVSDAGSASLSGSQPEVGGTEIGINQNFPIGTNTSYSIAFSNTTLQSIFLVANKNMTIKVNSTSSPILTINLVANTPYVWDASPGYWANPFSAAVTTFFVTNTVTGTLKGKVLNT